MTILQINENKKIMFISGRKEKYSGISSYETMLQKAMFQKYNLTFTSPRYFFNYPLILKNIKLKSLIHFTDASLAFPLYLMNQRQRARSIVTVQDIIPLQYPLFNRASHLRLKKLDAFFYKKSILSLIYARQIICSSNATKKALLKFIKYPEKNIKVIYLYIPKAFCDLRLNRNPFDILYVGSEMPHKNISILLNAIAVVKKKIPQIRLIKVGKSHWPGARKLLLEHAKKLGISENIVWKDTVENIVQEYNTATIVIHPSLHEGFGYPVLEAMACGCPVICSDRDSLPEVGGNAVQYFNPIDSNQLAQKMINLIENKKEQKILKKKGLIQSKKFNQESFCNHMIKTYEEMFNETFEQDQNNVG
ncbi:MAG: glycosyltransferase family 1 protein [Candidatus Woesearchaeota archaeon]|jgi:glycosyltransferase involved in cell wall biosynthesis